ncbi:MAG: FAD-binding oxidoreductase [Candidatus Hydrothermarchaeales archaeon]
MFERIREIVGEQNFSEEEAELVAYSGDSSIFKEKPLCVARPSNKEEIVEIVKFANENKLPIIPRGAGTNPCGEVVGKAIILDLTQMNKIEEINTEDRYVVLQPGVVLDVLNAILKEKGFFFPPDPASSRVCTIGGMAANNSSGLHAVKYGTTKDYVLALELVMPNGGVINTGSRAIKSASGYDLTSLFVGSEGTLGVFTEVTLRIIPLPEYSETVLFGLKSLTELKEACPKLLKLTPSAFEIVDDICLRTWENIYDLDFKDNKALVILEFNGAQGEVKNSIKKAKEAISGDSMVIDEIWEYRKRLVPSLIKYKGIRPLPVTEDLGVPIAKVPEAIIEIKNIYKKQGFEVAIYGHAGDGNLHMRVFTEDAKSEKLADAVDAVYEYVLSLKGTITSEHGIGLLRARYMEKEHGSAMDIMRDIKKAFDENNIMNPGKMGL